MSFYRIYKQTERDRQIIYDYWDLLTLKKVGQKYGISRERVRQIFENNGLNVVEITKAIRDYKLFHKIESQYKPCSRCGKFFKLDTRRKKRNRLIKLCHEHFIKERYKVDDYKWQRAWMKKHPNYISPNRAKNSKKYYESHKQEARKRQREYYEENREYVNQRNRQYEVKRQLYKKDLI